MSVSALCARDLLARVESFLAGFEGDETQEGIDELIADVRAAIVADRFTSWESIGKAFDGVKARLFEHGDKNDGTNCPFWYVAVNAGVTIGRPVMISHGIWFSREAAEEHLKAKKHRYPKSAFVYCDSAHDSPTGLRGLMEFVRRDGKEADE